MDQRQRFFLSPTIMLRLFGLAKIPLLFMTAPKVLELDDQRIAVQIPLNPITRNHLGSMYFGALAIGADCAAGLLAMHHMRRREAKINLVFKDFTADFLKRPDGDVIFKSQNGAALAQLVDLVDRTGERHHQAVTVEAFCDHEVVARFKLTISLKKTDP